jgi:putative SOS response-associated peptidase YedK
MGDNAGMCGRFTQTSSIHAIAARYDIPEAMWHAQDGPPRYNLAPGAHVLAVRLDAAGRRELTRLKWGLVPRWSVTPKTSYNTSNARAETVDSKPAFRAAFKQRRCLIPADGWYEWAFVPGQKWKQPWYYQARDGQPLAMAGLWDHWQQRDVLLDTCGIVVCAANAVTAPVHDRMPALLGEADWAAWLDPDTPPEDAKALLRPCPEAWLNAWPVSRAVSLAKNEGPGLIEPVALG